MKSKKIYRLRSKDENEEFCFIGATVNIDNAKQRCYDAITNTTCKLSKNDIYTYIRENGNKDIWIFEEIPINQNGDNVRQITQYKIGEYENMTEESVRSINRRCYQKVYYKREKYECVCGIVLNKTAKKQHELTIRHIEYIRILEHNKKHKNNCACSLWIETYRYASHLKSATHKRRMECNNNLP